MRPWARALSCSICLGLATHSGAVLAQLYKYRDASGAWVYTDREPPAGTKAQTMSVDLEVKAPRITVEQSSVDGRLVMTAINDCGCKAEFSLQVKSAGNVTLSPDAGPDPDPDPGAGAGAGAKMYHAVLQPHSHQELLSAPVAGASVADFQYGWRIVLGTPGATHRPHEPYRAPFALGASFKVSQAYPVRISHNSPESQYAVDIAVPDGTPIYAAREGTVINVRHDFFRGAADPALLDQANVVEILHDDDTIGVYAHLHWESIRVQPGQSVRRGQYIADSGNTGATTGPHLHFAVIRNAGMRAESVPVQFAGSGGALVTPVTGMLLTAY
jgi:murein DD-endopeptidase MepM/ murein hydrolase activator NlpD